MRAGLGGRAPIVPLAPQVPLEATDFTRAITYLEQKWSELAESAEWQDARRLDDGYGPPFLRITRRLGVATASEVDPKARHTSASDTEAAEAATDDDDNEALLRRPVDQGRVVIYDIVYSPSYRVPVLYLTLEHAPDIDLEHIYELLTAQSQRPQMQVVGPVGALSMTDHPITGLPAYFIHPCRTAEATAAVGAGSSPGPVECLLLWLGLVGPSVGLTIPLMLAEALSRDSEREAGLAESAV